ncbi:protein DEFECTIVE IN MERISTEM SILENCING 3-like isoform X2 [Cucurbita pepo subsp. pepo]|uniref:protein DEFECTIVE IN MERISTEM SILENCING 3-like isoform X2 n=1 Tax=Cucurbita pepo subsp. pepo TaxID=3664 RepID=UPI000C9D943A|nr:protein DEFECTIVE IN MERISTEM SILENCING 3-like isoform X2 [Cucurbita pepo subsp. pepo]
MFQQNNMQLAIRIPTSPAQDSSQYMQVDQSDKSLVMSGDMQNGGFTHSEYIFNFSKKLEEDLQTFGMKIKQHEDNIKFLKTQKNKLDESILDLQIILGKYHSSGTPVAENEVHSHPQSEEETMEQIMRQEKSAAGIICRLNTHHGIQAYNITLTKDVLGIVARLGKVDDDNFGRLLSEYLGMETMLAIVCRTYDGVKMLETYDKEGCINKSSGLHGLGASIGRNLDGRFLVICLEHLRPYAGDFIPNDPQRRLDLLKPRLPNGECPPGFVGFAVNMINIDSTHFCFAANGYGLRETLFYSLFSRLQVYKTRADMLQALPCISDGALSLDGGIIKANGLFCLGNQEDVQLRFPKASMKSSLPESYIESERQMKELKWKKEKMIEDIKREQALLNNSKLNFDRKKAEFLKFLAESSSYAAQQQLSVKPERLTPR